MHNTTKGNLLYFINNFTQQDVKWTKSRLRLWFVCKSEPPPPQKTKLNKTNKKKKPYTVHWLPSTAERTHADSMVSTGKGTTVKFTMRRMGGG